MNKNILIEKLLSTKIVQGGMGVGVSMSNLAGNVALCGGMGTISTAVAGYNKPNFYKDPFNTNIEAVKQHILDAKEIAKGNGIVAVNTMVATKQYVESVKMALQSGVEAVVCGAGLALDLPNIAQGYNTLLAPIVSSARAVTVICKMWFKRYQVLPDFIVVEGSKAGGHLGFSDEEILQNTAPKLEKIISEVIDAIEPFAKQKNMTIPVYAAGGVFTGKDMATFTKLGASGAQIATRFIATHECDGSQEYKNIILNAKESDIAIIHSPAGLPGRAVRNPLINAIENKNGPRPNPCVRCLTPCIPKTTPFCIANALISAVKGDYEKGLFFCSTSVGRVNKMLSVKELMNEITNEWRTFK